MTTAERTDSGTGDRPAPDVTILTRKLTRDYVLGAAVVRAVRGVDLEIRRNEFTAIMGPSGWGLADSPVTWTVRPAPRSWRCSRGCRLPARPSC